MSDNLQKGECLPWRLKSSFSASSLCTVPVLFEELQTCLKAASSFFGNSLICYVMASCLILGLILKIVLDLNCLVFNSTFVRPKVFKPYKTKKLTICIILLSFSMADCPDHSVSHTNTQSETVCCNPIHCDPGFYVQTCQLNQTDDVCVPCDSKTYLLDSTNSSFPLPCVKHVCPSDTVITFSFPPSGFGCRLRCRCDKTRGFFGKDPCNCKRSPESRKKKGGKDDGKVSNNLKSNTDLFLKTAKTIVAFMFCLIVLVCCAYLMFYRNDQSKLSA